MTQLSRISRLLILALAATALSAGTAGAAPWPIKWSARAVIDPPDQTNAMRAVSCGSSSLCVAGDDHGNVITSTHPTGAASAWHLVNVDGSNSIRGLSCATASFCVAVDGAGNAIASTDPTGGAAKWVSTAIDSSHGLQGVSCPSASVCVAVDNAGNALDSTNAGAASPTWASHNVDGTNVMRAVSCRSATFCVAVDNKGNAVTSTDPTDASPTWTVHTGIDGSNDIGSLSCPATTLCVGTDEVQSSVDGRVISTTTPTAATAWHAAKLAGAPLYNTLFGVSCFSTKLCVALDDSGFVYTSIHPTGGASKWTAKKVNARGSPDAISCKGKVCVTVDNYSGAVAGRLVPPDTKITSGPANNSKIRDRTPTFKFKSNALEPHFRCKRDSAPYASCHSPKTYAAPFSLGKHTFKVKSIDPLGQVDPTPAKRTFTVIP
jgi:hypothetical protein